MYESLRDEKSLVDALWCYFLLGRQCFNLYRSSHESKLTGLKKSLLFLK